MIGRWCPGQRGGSWVEVRVCPETVRGAELDGIGRRRGDGQLALAIEGDDRAIEPDVDLDEPAGIAAPAPTRRQLEDAAAEVDGVVASDFAAVLEDEHPLEPDAGRDRPPGRFQIGRR